MKKKCRFLALLLALAMCLVACGSEQKEEKGKKKTIEEGVLKVGCHIGYAPMEYYEEDGVTPTGFDIELAQAIADEMGMELELVPCAWDAIFNNVENKSFDMIISGVSYTKEREEKHSLTNSYLSNGLVLVVKDNSTIKDIKDLDGRSVGAQLETTADYLIRDKKAEGLDIDLGQYENVVNAFEALERGDVEAVCADSVVANYYLVDKEGYKVVWQSEDVEPLCICLAKDNKALRDEVNETLKKLSENGELIKISNKYFGVDLTTQYE